MAEPITTSLLYPTQYGTGGLEVEVMGANPTATTYRLWCPNPNNLTDACAQYRSSLTLGPWASATLAPGAPETGIFEDSILAVGELPWTYSIRCEMSRSVPLVCTTTNVGGNDEDRQTHTVSDSSGLYDVGLDSFTHVPATIMAGHEFLTSGPAPAPTGDSESRSGPSGSGPSGSGPTDTPSASSSVAPGVKAIGLLLCLSTVLLVC